MRSEYLIHIFVISFLKKLKKCAGCFEIIHVPNGGFRNKSEAMKLQNMGVLAGVLDIMLIGNGWVYFIELKLLKGRLSESQKEFMKTLDSLNIKYDTIYADTPQDAVKQASKILQRVNSTSSSPQFNVDWDSIVSETLSSSILKS